MKTFTTDSGASDTRPRPRSNPFGQRPGAARGTARWPQRIWEGIGQGTRRLGESVKELGRSVVHALYWPAVLVMLGCGCGFVMLQRQEITRQRQLHFAGMYERSAELSQTRSLQAERIQRAESARIMALAVMIPASPTSKGVAHANLPTAARTLSQARPLPGLGVPGSVSPRTPASASFTSPNPSTLKQKS